MPGRPSRALELADDALLADRAADGDERAFAVLLRRHGPVLRAYITRLTRRPSESDDVLQEVALAAWQALPKLENPALVKAWLFRIAERQAFALLRKQPQHAELDDEVPAEHDEEARWDARRALQAALTRIPEQQAQVWVLREMGGLSYSEIAERLAIPESTVRGALAQARKKLLDSMGDAR
ncbi:RNA polymerase sigma factor [Amnibacterium sp.]|uniref:RNA polymerase sigma factor n=1 Tax=Amnibacterium sp. TaxID=1872496 RepID=UPI003F7C0263